MHTPRRQPAFISKIDTKRDLLNMMTVADVSPVSPPRFLIRGKTVLDFKDDGKARTTTREEYKLETPRPIFNLPFLTPSAPSRAYEWRSVRHKTWPVMPSIDNSSSPQLNDARRLTNAGEILPSPGSKREKTQTSDDSCEKGTQGAGKVTVSQDVSKSVDVPSHVTNVTVRMAKLQCYEWTQSSEMPRANTAPDVPYKYTYGLKYEQSTPLQKSPRTCGCKPRKPMGVVIETDSKCQACKASRGVGSTSLPKVSKRPSWNRQQLYERARQLSKKVEKTGTFQVEFSSAGSRQRTPTDDDCLYSRLKVSINSASNDQMKTPRGKPSKSRPLKQEQGIYRPMSRTTVKTPERGESPMKEKDPRSAENFKTYFLAKQQHQRNATRGKTTGAYFAPPNTTFDKYEGSIESESTAGRDATQALHSVAECNRAGDCDASSVASAHHEMTEEEIPQWAARNDNMSPTESVVRPEEEEGAEKAHFINIPGVEASSNGSCVSLKK